jgi:hypothetical protein
MDSNRAIIVWVFHGKTRPALEHARDQQGRRRRSPAGLETAGQDPKPFGPLIRPIPIAANVPHRLDFVSLQQKALPRPDGTKLESLSVTNPRAPPPDVGCDAAWGDSIACPLALCCSSPPVVLILTSHTNCIILNPTSQLRSIVSSLLRFG